MTPPVMRPRTKQSPLYTTECSSGTTPMANFSTNRRKHVECEYVCIAMLHDLDIADRLFINFIFTSSIGFSLICSSQNILQNIRPLIFSRERVFDRNEGRKKKIAEKKRKGKQECCSYKRTRYRNGCVTNVKTPCADLSR